MHDDELHRFKSDIHFLHYAADRYGYRRDRRESSVSSHVLRHPATDDKIVVRKDRDGHWTYFSVRDDRDHGTIIDFVQRRGRHLPSGPSARSFAAGSARRGRCPRLSTCPDARRARSSGRWPKCSKQRASRPRATTSPRGAFGRRPCPIALRGHLAPRSRAATCSSRTVTNRARSRASRSRTAASRGSRRAAPRPPGKARARAGDRELVVTESAIDALSHHQLHRAVRARATSARPERRAMRRSSCSIGSLRALRRGRRSSPPSTPTRQATDGEGHRGATRRLPHLDFRRDAPARAKDWNEVLQRVERDFILSLPRPARSRGSGAMTRAV